MCKHHVVDGHIYKIVIYANAILTMIDQQVLDCIQYLFI